MKAIGKQLKGYFTMSMVQFSSGYITVQGGLLYWLVSLIQIGSATLMIGNLLQIMFSALVQDLSLGPVRNNRLLHFLQQEAEYRAAVNASQEALWLRQILSEFGFQHQHPTSHWCDNQSAIKLAKDPVQHQRRKHIELHMHFIRKLIHDQVIEVLFCPTEDQVADIFKKSLTEVKFSKLRSMLGVQEVVIKGG
jgi:hypothetical protein